MKDGALASVAFWDASNRRLADARAVLPMLSDAQKTTARAALLCNLAVVSAKDGDVASALRLVGELHNPLNLWAALFTIAHAPPQQQLSGRARHAA